MSKNTALRHAEFDRKKQHTMPQMSTSIHDLHVDLLLNIFAHLGVRDLCIVEEGMQQQQKFVLLLAFFPIHSENFDVRQWAKCANGGATWPGWRGRLARAFASTNMCSQISSQASTSATRSFASSSTITGYCRSTTRSPNLLNTAPTSSISI